MLPATPRAVLTGLRRPLAIGALICAVPAVAAAPTLAAEGRVYERVSRADKVNGNPLNNGSAGGASAGFSAEDGNTFLWRPYIGADASDAERGLPSPVRAKRTSSGWTQSTVAQGPVPGASTAAPYFNQTYNLLPSADLLSVAFTQPMGYDATLPPETTRFANGGLFKAGADGRARLISRSTWPGATTWPDGRTASSYIELVGGASDLSTVFFTSRLLLTPEDGASGRASDTSWNLYRYTESGGIASAAKLPNGELDPDGAVAAGYSSLDINGNDRSAVKQAWTRSVSTDGRSALFVSPDPSTDAAQTRRPQLYRTVDGGRGTRISARDGGEPEVGTSGVLPATAVGNFFDYSVPYAVATPDHRYVFFATNDVLTDDVAPADAPARKTYRYDTRSGSTTYLAALTIPEPGANGPGVMLAVSDDGQQVLYLEDGTLRLWDDGQSVDVSAPGLISQPVSRASFVPGGDALAIDATGDLADPQPPGDPQFADGSAQNTYRFDIASSKLTCLTCGDAGHPNPGGRSSYTNNLAEEAGGAGETIGRGARNFTADGRSWFVTTATALVPEDRNAVADVYELRDGRPTLVSTGARGAKPAYYMDNSSDGRDVFIGTGEPLVAEDDDGLIEIYDARVGGGFPEPPVEVTCSGDACQPPPGAPQAPPAPQSAAGVPVTTGKRDAPPALPKTATVRVRSARGTTASVTLRVAVNGKGRLLVTSPALRTVRQTVAGAGTYRVRIALSQASRRTLERRGRLRVTARVRFSRTAGVSATRTITLTIKRAKR